MSRVIVDVLDGDLFFHCKGKIERSIKNSQEKHFYLVKVSSGENKKIYEDLFTALNYTEYHICNPDDQVDVPWLLRLLCRLKKNNVPQEELSLLTEIYRHRKDILLIHGNLFSAVCTYFLLLNHWKSLNWICWGNFLDTHKVDSGKIAIQFFCLKLLYRKFKRIICLMQPDVVTAQKKYGCRRVFLCPYPGVWNLHSEPEETVEKNDKILVGNSAHSVYSYIDLTEKLIPYKDSIHLTFMIPYGTEYASLAEGVVKLRNLLQSEGFKHDFWDKVLSYKEYEKEMSKYRYYICPYETQTGLGAIYKMIDNESTVYLTGFNFDWLSFLGFKVCSIKEFLERLEKQEALELETTVREENKKLFRHLWEPRHRIRQLECLLMIEHNLNKLDSNWL